MIEFGYRQLAEMDNMVRDGKELDSHQQEVYAHLKKNLPPIKFEAGVPIMKNFAVSASYHKEPEDTRVGFGIELKF